MLNKTSTVSIMLIGLIVIVIAGFVITNKKLSPNAGNSTTSGYSNAIGWKKK